MRDEENIYKSVPGQGNYLEDGTWWTNSPVNVGYISKSSRGTSKAIEVANFDGERFVRWQWV
jgi:hypothetical protein